MAELRTDRYFHVFEVIYPENRFPAGLGIVDYGLREDLVLTSMRDRLTNRMLTYAEVVAEARRVGLSHPRVFEGGLAEVYHAVDIASPTLHEEGFIIHTLAEGKLYKLKYQGYKEVLRMVNEMRTDRFVREHLALGLSERAEALALLPAEIQSVALLQLGRHREIKGRLVDYCVWPVATGPENARAFVDFVRQNVPEPFQRLIFQYHRNGPDAVELILEKLAVEIYDRKLALPFMGSV